LEEEEKDLEDEVKGGLDDDDEEEEEEEEGEEEGLENEVKELREELEERDTLGWDPSRIRSFSQGDGWRWKKMGGESH